MTTTEEPFDEWSEAVAASGGLGAGVEILGRGLLVGRLPGILGAAPPDRCLNCGLRVPTPGLCAGCHALGHDSAEAEPRCDICGGRVLHPGLCAGCQDEADAEARMERDA